MKNKELYTHIFEYDGQACVAISNPTPCETVKVYDLDAGEFFTLDIQTIYDAVKVRPTEEFDFQFSSIVASPWADEAQEICSELFY